MDVPAALPPVITPAAEASAPGRPRPGRWWLGAMTGGAFALLGAVLFVWDPAQHDFYPRCVFRALTGWECPGCGGLRAVHALLHGDLATAWRWHPLLVGALGLTPLFLPGVAPRSWRAAARRFGPAALLAAIAVFGLVRNW